jgi:hypothetical protein
MKRKEEKTDYSMVTSIQNSFQQMELFLNLSLLSFIIFFDLEQIIFENFNVSENNI